MASQQARFTWMDFYSEFANSLLAFKDDRQALLGKLDEAYASAGMKLPRLDSNGRPSDIDPFTVFGLFNKGVSEATRLKVIGAIGKTFHVDAPKPSDFDGIPNLNNLNATFYAFRNDANRGEHDIDRLWRAFETALAYADAPAEATRSAFVAAYDATVGQHNLGWRLSTGLYWVRPNTFLSLDSRNLWYIGKMGCAGEVCAAAIPHSKTDQLPDGENYLGICEAVCSQLGTAACPQDSLSGITYAAYVESERVNQEKKGKGAAAPMAVSPAAFEEDALGDADVESVRYWLIAPGSEASKWDEFYSEGIIGLAWSRIGSVESFDTKEELRTALHEAFEGEGSKKNQVLALWQFCHDMKPGDIVYAKRGHSQIIGRGIVRSGYRFDDTRADGYKNVRVIEWTHRGSWAYPGPGLAPTKTLTDVTAFTDRVQRLEALFEDEEGDEPKVDEVAYPSYGVQEFLADAYMDAESYRMITSVLRAKRNIILQGAPGVGKTYIAKRLAYSMMGVKDASRVMMVQFHQSYSYEDFIEGYRPNESGFELVEGAFCTFCDKAAEDGENPYFFIIDEINRGNLSKIFGELFMLIEADKRGWNHRIPLLYSHRQFYVPENVFIIGMMNTADRSLALLDYALRRRFAFFDLKPGFGTEGFIRYRDSLESPKFDALIRVVERLNEAIAADESLGEGFCVGHSYFCGLESGGATEGRLSAIVDFELVPMLKEYWFEEPARVREWADRLHGAIR